MSLNARLRGLGTELQPDPPFRRRLRSEILNRYVAVREGLEPVPERRWIGREMGRLGRACLYASVALGVSAASILGVTQETVPGEALYGLKLRIEELRVEVLPRHLHDDLALNVLSERIDEVRRLSAEGSIDAALALAPAVERGYAEVRTRFASADPFGMARLEHRLAVIARLVESMPPNVREMLSSLIPELARVDHDATLSSVRGSRAQRTG